MFKQMFEKHIENFELSVLLTGIYVSGIIDKINGKIVHMLQHAKYETEMFMWTSVCFGGAWVAAFVALTKPVVA